MCHIVHSFAQTALLTNVHCNEPSVWFEASGFCHTINTGSSWEFLSDILLSVWGFDTVGAVSSCGPAVHRWSKCWGGSLKALELGLGDSCIIQIASFPVPMLPRPALKSLPRQGTWVALLFEGDGKRWDWLSYAYTIRASSPTLSRLAPPKPQLARARQLSHFHVLRVTRASSTVLPSEVWACFPKYYSW